MFNFAHIGKQGRLRERDGFFVLSGAHMRCERVLSLSFATPAAFLGRNYTFDSTLKEFWLSLCNIAF
jgi:hypothetical protein